MMAECPGSEITEILLEIDTIGLGKKEATERLFSAVYDDTDTTETVIDLTPVDGTLVETDDPYWSTKGYRIVPDYDMEIDVDLCEHHGDGNRRSAKRCCRADPLLERDRPGHGWIVTASVELGQGPKSLAVLAGLSSGDARFPRSASRRAVR